MKDLLRNAMRAAGLIGEPDSILSNYSNGKDKLGAVMGDRVACRGLNVRHGVMVGDESGAALAAPYPFVVVMMDREYVAFPIDAAIRLADDIRAQAWQARAALRAIEAEKKGPAQ